MWTQIEINRACFSVMYSLKCNTLKLRHRSTDADNFSIFIGCCECLQKVVLNFGLKLALMFVCVLIILKSHCIAEVEHETFYCQERKLGWHFYCEKPKSPAPKKLSTPATRITVPKTALKEIDSIRAELQELRAEAVLRPTVENVKTYIAFQRKQLDRASVFSDVWRRVIWSNPDLDYNLLRPVGQTSKRNWIDERNANQENFLLNLHEQYGLMYLYSSNCSACLQFSPILSDFATKFSIDVKAISTDGGSTPYFPEAVANQGQLSKLGLANFHVPAVLLFDSHSKSIIPVSFGVVSQSELIERLYVLTQIDTGEDY